MLKPEKLGARHGTVFAIELIDQEEEGVVIDGQLLGDRCRYIVIKPTATR
jgi:hypothetical protein